MVPTARPAPPAGIQRPRDGGVIGIVAGTRRERPTLPPPRHAPVNQPRIDCHAGLGAKTEALHDTGPVAFEQHVDLSDQPMHQSLAVGMLEVDANGFLAPVGDCLAPAAEHLRREGAARTFKQSYLGPHVGKQHAAKRAGTDTGEFENLDPGKRALAHGLGIRSIHLHSCQRFLKAGLRFSRKAAIPSCLSSKAKEA